MDASIVTQIDERNKRRAILTAAHIFGNPNGADKKLYYTQQIQPGTYHHYFILLPDIRCTSQDTRCTDPLHCVHANAARIYIAAHETVEARIAELGITAGEAANRIERQLETCTSADIRDRLAVLFSVARHLHANEQRRRNVVLS